MADNINIVINNERRLGLKFEKFPEEFRVKLLSAIEDLTQKLLARVLAAAPKGQTGRLERSIHAQIFNDKTKVTGRVVVGADFAKAGALEYGGTGEAFKVKAHSARLDHVFRNKLTSPLDVMVAAHNRQLNMAARRFLRDPAAAIEPEVVSELREAVNQTVGESNSE
jgi:hypothetical protein